jgi:ABC-type amino acid transport system permease subunit
MFSIVALCRPYILVIHRIISTTLNTLEITKSFFYLALVCHVVTCAFYVSRFEMAIIFRVPISLTVCTLSNIPVVFRLFGFHFGLFYMFYIEYVFVI